MISTRRTTQPTVTISTKVPQVGTRLIASSLKRMRLYAVMWLCLALACIGASWFSYQCLLNPQPASYAPDWQGAQWVRVADGAAPVAYFRYVTDLNTLPDGAFVTVAASQVFRLYVNGNFIGSSVNDFIRGNFPRAYMYDVSSSLQIGPNVIAIRVANVDQQAPALRASLGIVQGTSVIFQGTNGSWQATRQSTAVYPRYASSLSAWATADFDASSWPSAQPVASPSITPTLTINPLVYERPVPTQWISVGGSHDAFFVRQLTLPADVSNAWLRVAATGTASIFVNGQLLVVWNGQAPVVDQEINTYLSDDETIVPYRKGLALGVYDIASYLHAGANTLAVHVSAPGVSAAQVGLDSLNAAMATDLFINNSGDKTTWLIGDNASDGSNWHASSTSLDGWAQGNYASLTWPSPYSVGRPGAVHSFYLPDSNSPRNLQIVPLAPLGEIILASTAAVLGTWLLVSPVCARRYYASSRRALETMSLAYIPALTCEALLIVLAREPQIPQPFPYTWCWALGLLAIVGLTYLLLLLNARTVHGGSRAGTSSAPTLHARIPLRKGLVSLYSMHPGVDRKRQHNTRAGTSPARTLHELETHAYRVRAGLVPALGAARHTAIDSIRVTRAWLRVHWPLILLLLIAIPLIAYDLPYEPYWQDELTSFDAAKGILAHGYPVLPSGFIYPKGELYSYVLALWMLIFGDQGGAPRMLSVVEYLVSLPLLYAVGSYFFERRIALLATAMLAFSPYTLIWGRQVRMYEQAQVLTLLVVFFFYKAVSATVWTRKRAVETFMNSTRTGAINRAPTAGRKKWIYIAVGCLLLDYLSHEEIFIILPALVICVLIASRHANLRLPAVLHEKHWWIASAIGGGVILLQLGIVNLTHPPVLGTDASLRPFIQLGTENVLYYFRLLFLPPRQEPSIALNSLLAALGCFWARRSTDRRVKYCALFLLISLLTLVLVFNWQADRYFYPLLPVYYLMGAYALLTMLRAIAEFARSRVALPRPVRAAKPILGGYLSRPVQVVLLMTVSLLCACVLIVPMLPISNYNLFISRLAGFSYHRHYPDYDVAGQYLQQHWREGDIVITVAPDYTVAYYGGHVDYFFSIDRALFLFERDSSIVDTSLGDYAILNQADFQAVLATYPRIWIVSDNGYYQQELKKNGRFTFPADFRIVYEGYGSAIYFRGG